MEAEAKAGEAEAEAEAEAGFHSRVVINASMITRHEHDLNDVNDCRGVIFAVSKLSGGSFGCWLSLDRSTWFVTHARGIPEYGNVLIPAMDSGSFGPGW